MGFINNIGNKVRAFLGPDREEQKRELAKGATVSSAMVGYGRDMMQAFGYDVIASYLSTDNDLLSRYADYESMDDDAYITTALDIIAEDTTQPSPEHKRSLWIKSTDKTLELILNKDLLDRRLNTEGEIWTVARTLCLYGSDFEEMLVDETGVVGLNYLPTPTMRRIEGPHGDLHGYVQDFRGKYGFAIQEYHELLRARHEDSNKRDAGTPVGSLQRTDRPRPVALENWEVVHFRLPGKYRRTVYGLSCLESARWHWKRMSLLEDAALLYRLQRAPERFAFYVDVGDLPPQEALAYVNKVRQMHKKKRFLDPSTGRLNMKWEALSPDDDFWIPTRQGQQGARVEVLGAPAWQCLVGSTPIPQLDGTSMTMKEMAERGGSYSVYSSTEDGRMVPGHAHSVRMTHAEAEIWEVGLDNGEFVSCTGNHPFLTRDGRWVLAENLVAGDSLMPLYRKLSAHPKDYIKGYEKVYDPIGTYVPNYMTEPELKSLEEPDNHKVTSVRKTDRKEPVYDLTVDDTHCFAVGQGVFVHNSVVDLEFFRDKIFAAIKVPKSYLGQEQGVARSTLSSEDVRFARLVLRVQREICGGYRQICRTHLAAVGIEPDNVEYDVHMQVPSAIYQLAQMEVQNARADLAMRMKEFVSEYWIYSKIFDMSDEEIETIAAQREEEAYRNAATMAKSQGLSAQIMQTMVPQPAPLPAAGSSAAPSSMSQPPSNGAPPAAESLDDLVKRHWSPYTVPARDSMRSDRSRPSDWERNLMRGDRKGEKRAEQKLDEVLRNDRRLTQQLLEVRELLRDLSLARGSHVR